MQFKDLRIFESRHWVAINLVGVWPDRAVLQTVLAYLQNILDFGNE